MLPVSIKGKVVDEDVETSQLSVTSEKWKNYILGGNYNDVEYPGIFSYTIHDVNNFSLNYLTPNFMQNQLTTTIMVLI